MNKIESLYNLYLEQGIITSQTSLEDFTQANPEVQSKLYDLGKGSGLFETTDLTTFQTAWGDVKKKDDSVFISQEEVCLLYTSPSPRDRTRSRMPSSA